MHLGLNDQMNYNVFVYGTLRQRGTNHHIIAQARCVEHRKKIYGYALYDYAQEYPFMVQAQPEEYVVGEVYEVNPELLNDLHILEDIANNLYKFIFLESEACYTYVKFDQEVSRMQKIKGGDWIKYTHNI